MNNILKYTSKDYESIKEDLLDSISALTSTWTSREEGDPGIVLVKLMSALGDMLSFNADMQALEYYAPTVTQRKNAARLFELIGYKMHWYRTAKTMLTLTNKVAMPEYIFMYKQFLSNPNDEEAAKSLYIDYYNKYKDDTGLVISYPPQDESLPEGAIRCTFTYNAVPTTPTEITNSQGSGFNRDGNIPQPGIPFSGFDFFKYVYSHGEGSEVTETYMLQDIYNDWAKDSSNSVGIYTYIEDPNKTLGVYASGTSSSLLYSLIPTTQKPEVNSETGKYKPTYILRPYEQMTIPAIQGYLCTTTFNRSQLKGNRYYIPDTAIDEDYMYLAYITTDTPNGIETPIYLKKVDNLLTQTTFTDENSGNQTIVYYQFGVDEFDFPYIELISYWEKVIPATATKFKFSYFKTEGKYGNITTNYLTRIATNSSIEVSVLNEANSDYKVDINGTIITEPGKNPQTAREAYIDSLNYVMTYDTLVTIYDFTRFIKRQGDTTNSFSCDKQRSEDLYTEISNTVDTYTESQLRSILGENSQSISDVNTLRNELKAIRKVNFDYRDNQIKKQTPTTVKPFANYSINLYPIWGDYKTYDGVSIATFTNYIDGQYYPYYVYCINTYENLTGQSSISEENYKLETMFNKALREVQIVNVEARYTGCRVFKWKCCGTLHLTQSVSEDEANLIIQRVIANLNTTYTVKNMQIGKKLTYMEVIDTVLSSDSRIRYFDAGIGNIKLINFTLPYMGSSNLSEYYDVEAYFNPESIMKYEQEITDNLLIVDPMYIQKTVSD